MDPIVPAEAPLTRGGFRRARLKFRLAQLRKQWRVYYRSNYGKAGLYILVIMAALTILSPLLILHNPNTFIAPPEDASTATINLVAPLPFATQINGSPEPASASALASSGSYLVYVTSASGAVYGVGLGGSHSTSGGKVFPLLPSVLPAGSHPFGAEVFPLASLTTFLSNYSFGYHNYLLRGASGPTNSTLTLAEVDWSGSNGPGTGTPFAARLENLTINGSLLLPPTSSAPPTTILPSWGPFADSRAYRSDGLQPGYVYAVVRTPTGIYLNEYFDYPLSLAWSARLPGTGIPSTPHYVGSFFSGSAGVTQTRVLIEQNASLLAFAATSGHLLWRTNFTSPLKTGIGSVIPFDYQVGYLAAGSVAFVVLQGAPGQVDTVSLDAGSVQPFVSVPGGITGLTTSYGSSGLPTYVIIQTGTTAYFVVGGNVAALGADAVPLPTGFGSFESNPLYIPDSGIADLTSSAGYSFGVSTSLGAYPIQWHIAFSPASEVAAPILLINSATGRESIAFVTSANELVVYAATGTDANPLPPTFHAPSGNIYPFGTNTVGNDLFSQWAASFPYDWAIGLAVAAGIMLISVVAAMFIGFVSGWAAAFVETLTLVLFLTPGLALLIVVASIAGPTFTNIILVLTFVGWPFTALTLIGVVKSVRSRTFIEAARVSGAGTLQILRRHMLPNMTPLLAYFTALSIGGAVVGLSTLQFLGVAPLTIPTWGGMLQPLFDNFYLAAEAPWWIIPPTVTLTAFVFAFIFVSRGLDEVVNPRVRRR
ncbi:MAG: ABC transporter permease [Thermoplasmata archaeon]